MIKGQWGGWVIEMLKAIMTTVMCNAFKARLTTRVGRPAAYGAAKETSWARETVTLKWCVRSGNATG